MFQPTNTKYKPGDMLMRKNAVIFITRTGLSMGGQILYFFLEDGMEYCGAAANIDTNFRLVA
jgi:hypothetical protein